MAPWLPMLGLALAVAGCERIVPEPPPPQSRYEVVPAPPGARGARAAGTESAPKPPLWRSREPGESTDSEEGAEPPVEDGGAAEAPETGIPL